MGYMIIGITVNVIEYWILIFMMQYICSAHMKLTKKNIILCTVASVLLNFFCFLSNQWYTEFLMFALIALTVLLLSSRKIYDLLLFFPAFALYLILSIIPEAILHELLPSLKGSFVIDGYTVKIAGLVIDALLFFILILLRHILLKYETTVYLSTKEVLGCIGLLFFSLIDVALLMSVNQSDMQPVYYYLWKIIFAGAFLFSTAFYLFSLIDARVRVYRQALTRSETEYLRVQLDSLQDVKENETQIAHLRHDLQNHLTVIQSLCDEGNYEEIKNYTKQLGSNIVLTGSNVLTGNKVADLVIRSKLKTAKEHDIDFTFTGSLEHMAAMDDSDICGLLANAYDNAIEACLSQEHPYIHTTVSTTRHYTVIKIANSVDKKVSVRGNRIPTTKKDKHSHGYGIDIMNRIAHKYSGNCTLHSSENEFTVKIVLLL